LTMLALLVLSSTVLQAPPRFCSLCAIRTPSVQVTGEPGLRIVSLATRASSRLRPVCCQLVNDELDDLIRQLRECTPEQLTQVLSENLNNIDQRLFLRLAEMSDVATDEYEKLRINMLATTVTSTLETIISQLDKQLDTDAQMTQNIMRTVAAENGEFEIPIPIERLTAMRSATREYLPRLDEGYVGTIKAYMKKASDDQMEGLLSILRQMLQTFAAERLIALLNLESTEADESISPGLTGVLTSMLESPADEWSDLLSAELSRDDAETGADELLQALQDRMGQVVLGMPAGSGVQSVLAEYLSELIDTVQKVAADID